MISPWIALAAMTITLISLAPLGTWAKRAGESEKKKRLAMMLFIFTVLLILTTVLTLFALSPTPFSDIKNTDKAELSADLYLLALMIIAIIVIIVLESVDKKREQKCLDSGAQENYIIRTNLVKYGIDAFLMILGFGLVTPFISHIPHIKYVEPDKIRQVTSLAVILGIFFIMGLFGLFFFLKHIAFKVEVDGKNFTVHKLFKKPQSYSFNEISIKKLPIPSWKKSTARAEYSIYLSENREKNPIFKMTNQAEGAFFIEKLRFLGKID